MNMNLGFDWKYGMSDDVLRKRLKVHFKMAGQAEEVVFSAGQGHQMSYWATPRQVDHSHGYRQEQYGLVTKKEFYYLWQGL